MKRRDFIRTGSAGIVLPTLVGGLGVKAYGSSMLASALGGSTDTDRVLVMIYLDGGNDGLNTVVPYAELSTMNVLRPHVVLPESSLLPLSGTDIGLHPGLSGFRDLYEDGMMQIIQNVGYEDPNYSHFRSTDIWMSGSDSNVVLNSGWSGRYLDYEYPNYPIGYPSEEVPDPLAVEIGYSTSLVFQGATTPMGMVIASPEDFYELLDNIEGPVPNTLAGDQLRHVRLIRRQSNEYGVRVKDVAESVTNQLDYPENNPLADQLRIVARLIGGGLQTRLYMVRIGGFDTHDAQVMDGDHTQGMHNELLSMLGDAVKAFQEDLTHLGVDDRVTGLTFSEFGRRIVSNASLGTDHGSAAPLFVFGKHVEGGVVGTNPELDTGMTYYDNLPHEFDFRSIYYSLFKDWFCVPQEDLSTVFLKDFDYLRVVDPEMACTITDNRDLTQTAGEQLIEVYPSHTSDRTTVEVTSSGQIGILTLVDPSGRAVIKYGAIRLSAGKHRRELDLSSLSAGVYYLIYSEEDRRQARPVVRI